MAFKEVASLDTDVTIQLGGVNRKTGKKNPVQIEGYYLGSKKVESKKSKTGFAYLHVLQTPKGNVGVWGKTDLDRKLGSATPGTMIRATHTGMLATPNGEMYKYKVEVDTDNSIEVDANIGAAPAAETDSDETEGYSASAGSYSDDEESTYGESEEAEESEAPAVEVKSSLLAAKERAAKVQALLAKNKKN